MKTNSNQDKVEEDSFRDRLKEKISPREKNKKGRKREKAKCQKSPGGFGNISSGGGERGVRKKPDRLVRSRKSVGKRSRQITAGSRLPTESRKKKKNREEASGTSAK